MATIKNKSWWEGDVWRNDTVISEATPGYHTKVRSGQVLPDNPFAHYGMWRSTTQMEVGVWFYDQVDTWYLARTDVRRYAAFVFGNPKFDWGIPTNKFLSKVKASSVSVITMMAQRKKTASLLTELAGNVLYTMVHWKQPVKVVKRWLKADQKIRKWKMRKLERRILRCTTPAEAWLEYRFAIRPTMYDIKDALEAFEKSSDKQHICHISQKDWESNSDSSTKLGPYNTVSGHLNYRFDWKIVGRFRIDDSSIAALGNLASVGASLWDLIPFSFLVDWAVDVSTYLDLQNATLGLTFVSGFRGLKQTTSISYSTHINDDSPYVRYIPCDDFNATYRVEEYNRSVLHQCPVPYLRRDGLEGLLETRHIVDMLALARQIWAGKVKSTYHFR